MQHVFTEGVDPRDIKWEVDQPVYRVYFWYQPPALRVFANKM